MAKRYTDTEKYRKTFMRGLPSAYKLLWDYIVNDCDHAGIWLVDFEIAQICIGKDAPVGKDKALRLFNDGEDRILEIEGGRKWFIISFVEFQYGKLSESCKPHIPVIKILKSYNLLNPDLTLKLKKRESPLQTPPKGYPKGIHTLEEKEKEKEMEMEMEMEMESLLEKGGMGEKTENSPNVENHCTEGDKKTENGKSEKSSQEFAAENEDANRGDLSHEKNQGGQIITEDRESAADAKKTSKTGLCTPNINPQKTENGKSEKSSQEFAAAEVLDELSFENVWAMYERKGNRKSSQRRWDGLPKKAKLLAVAHIPRYVAATPEIQYRKNFETYIGQEAWNDEIITKNGTDSRFTSTENGYSGNGANTFRTDAERRRNERQMLAQVATAVLQQPETQKD